MSIVYDNESNQFLVLYRDQVIARALTEALAKAIITKIM